jgi:hypothetical protein
MKHKDVLFTVLSEVTGKPIEQIRDSFPAALSTPKMKEELTDDEANQLLDGLRKEKSGILNWALTGLRRRIAESN